LSLERKDVRFKIAPDMHQALTVLAEISQVDIGEFVEMVINREVLRRVHEASVIAERTSRLGITGIGRESPGMSGK
jgi:predicted HicB family RNase H-like nuclease